MESQKKKKRKWVKGEKKKCCICSGQNHSCVTCQCTRRGQACIDCRAGDKCQNRIPSHDKLQFTNVKGDGNCLFRCIAYALFKDENRHSEIRKEVCDHMENDERYKFNKDDEEYSKYIEHMRKDRTWGTDLQIRASAEIYGVQIFVHSNVAGKWEWLPHHGPDVSNDECDHDRDFIALDHRSHHFRIIEIDNRPCKCNKSSAAVQSNKPEKTNIVRNNKEKDLNTWYGIDHTELERWIDEIYEEITMWTQKNLFEAPVCVETKELIQLMTELIISYVEDSKIASISLKFAMILPTVFLQKTRKHPKKNQNINTLRRRLDHLKNGDLVELREEMRTVRLGHKTSQVRFGNLYNTCQKFTKSMMKGRVRNALRLISEEGSNGPLRVTPEVKEELVRKHPKGIVAEKETKIQEKMGSAASYLFDEIDEEMVWKKALKTQGGAGPSGLNADMMKNLLSTKQHGEQSTNLRTAIAKLAQKLATENCQNLDAYTARRLLPLEKKPKGVRPIGIGEILNRIIGKCVMQVTQAGVKRAAGNLQVCAGHQAGGEAAIHAMREIFEDPDIEAILLVDAKNAFNNINRDAMLHNISMKCPILSKYVENTYGTPSDLYIEGGEVGHDVIKSEEGTTQGDPVAMAMYAIGLSVLQDNLTYEETKVKSVAYADDYIGAGTLQDLRTWWNKLENKGKKFGYITNANKSCLIVKPGKEDQAKRVFNDSPIQITAEGHEHLGAVIGTETFKTHYLQKKVEEWKSEITRLSEIAKTEPHAAFTAFTHGLKHKWTYIARTIPDISGLMEPLEDAIKTKFIPSLINKHCSEQERDLLSLPPSLGGLGIINPAVKTNQEFINSTKLTSQLKEFIIAQDNQGVVDDMAIDKLRKQISDERQKKQREKLNEIERACDKTLRQKIQLATETGASSWLTSLPIKAKGFMLNKQEFNDAIALRYGWPIEGLPDRCPGCSEVFDESHANTCQKGGYIAMRHDEIRDLNYELLTMVVREVQKEPPLQPCSGVTLSHSTSNTQVGARVDLSARGFWTRGERAFFDVRIFEPSAKSYSKMKLSAAYEKNERDKIRTYRERIQRVEQGTFTPLVFSTSGGMSNETKTFYKRIAELMAEKRGETKGYFTAWMRVRLSFALLRSAILCIRGARSSKRALVNLHNFDFEAAVFQSNIRI